jgi:nucleoside phosphorylase
MSTRTTFADCDKSLTIQRESRHGLLVHFDIVASGNQVIKDGVKRRKILESHPGVIAIEMEAAGLINVFGCATYRLREKSPSTWVFWVHTSSYTRFELLK